MPNGHIIVADDDAAIRTVLNQALSRAGYEVRSTGNCATLWRWVAQGEGDLVITDVVMPDENVFDLLPRIKRARGRVFGVRRHARVPAAAQRGEKLDQGGRFVAVRGRQAVARRQKLGLGLVQRGEVGQPGAILTARKDRGVVRRIQRDAELGGAGLRGL